MKIAVLYILALCLLTIGKNSYANDIQHVQSGHLIAKHIGKMQAFKFANIHQDASVFTNSTPSDDEETILRAETEDEDFVFRRKFVLAVNYFILVAGASFLIYFLSCFKQRLYYFKQVFTVSPSKYILQGALRI